MLIDLVDEKRQQLSQKLMANMNALNEKIDKGTMCLRLPKERPLAPTLRTRRRANSPRKSNQPYGHLDQREFKPQPRAKDHDRHRILGRGSGGDSDY
jgi:hypothetical protein